MKKRLTNAEEFEIMKMVLDKFLWLGTVILGIAMYNMITGDLGNNLALLFAGIVILVIFVIILVREYEVIK